MATTPLEIVCGWTVIRGKRELNRWHKENLICYRGAPSAYPCLVRLEISSDENSQTQILEQSELEVMLAELKK